MSVSDKTAIITGAGSARGIGRATAHALAAAGWNIAILDIDEAAAKDAATEIAERHSVHAIGVACDVTDETSVDHALEALAASVPPVGALVNNAGITSPTPFLQVTGEEWDRIFAVNVRGAYNITRRIMPGMAERGFGRVVFLSSVSAERGGGVFGGVAYSAAKAAQLGFARALAREAGPHGITVNSVAPVSSTPTSPPANSTPNGGTSSSPASRSAAPATCTTSPTSSPTCAAKNPATSPAPPTTSTAAPTSTDDHRCWPLR
jgi:NAD(P)-dependent dehydrogenase (short-subunit alcohol dehydrogenase family)